MTPLNRGSYYTRKEVWAKLKPGAPFPADGNWTTGYVREGQELFIFANIGVAGRTGHDFPNQYDSYSGLVDWFGKPNAHSAQPTFRDLFLGQLIPQIFVRWDSNNVNWLYLGSGIIEDYRDNVDVPAIGKTIEVKFRLETNRQEQDSPPADGVPVALLEGGKSSVQVNRYERDPRLRHQCITALGPVCRICDFDFEATYGEIGRGYCHVHHLVPLSEVASEHEVDPLKDLLPVCPNCHAMLHSKVPALQPDYLKSLLRINDEQS